MTAIMPEVRRLLLEGKFEEAGDLVHRHSWMLVLGLSWANGMIILFRHRVYENMQLLAEHQTV